MKLRGPRSALHGWQDARQRQRARAAAERRAWRKVYEDFAFRVHGHVMFEERPLNKSATVWAPCADWLFVLVGTYLPETHDEGGGRPARWITSATLRYESAARGRRGKDTPPGDTGEFSGRRAPATWRGRITGRNTVWALRFYEDGEASHLGDGVTADRLVQLHDAVATTMGELRRTGEAEPRWPPAVAAR